jgi:hypothetical protein
MHAEEAQVLALANKTDYGKEKKRKNALTTEKALAWLSSRRHHKRLFMGCNHRLSYPSRVFAWVRHMDSSIRRE